MDKGQQMLDTMVTPVFEGHRQRSNQSSRGVLHVLLRTLCGPRFLPVLTKNGNLKLSIVANHHSSQSIAIIILYCYQLAYIIASAIIHQPFAIHSSSTVTTHPSSSNNIHLHVTSPAIQSTSTPSATHHSSIIRPLPSPI